MRRVSKKRESQLREYTKRRAAYLAAHPVCEVWLRENGWQQIDGKLEYEFSKPSPAGRTLTLSALQMLHRIGAPQATEIHHTNKRRGAMLNDETHWLAVCRANHERIENDKAWARREGFLLNF